MTDTASAPAATTESVEEFAARARTWLAENMPPIDPANPPEHDRGEEEPWQRARELQKKLYEGGFAGHLLPARVRRPRPSDRLPEGVQQRIALLRTAGHPEHPDLHDLRRDHPRHRVRRAEAATHLGRAAR